MKRPAGEWKERNGSWFKKEKFIRWIRHVKITCFQCKEEFFTRHPHSKTCSKKCMALLRWNSTPIEKRWRVVKRNRKGYVFIHAKGHKHLIPEHRHVMEQHIKRPLESHEHVHHIDGNRANNNINNLIILTRSDHNTIHKSEQSKNWDRNKDGKFK